MTNLNEIGRDVARNIFKTSFYKRGAERWIEGIALTGEPFGSDGLVLNAAGANYELPLPLLRNHRWTEPLGEVRTIQRVDKTLRFRARICDREFPWSVEWPVQLECGVSFFAVRLDSASTVRTVFDARVIA